MEIKRNLFLVAGNGSTPFRPIQNENVPGANRPNVCNIESDFN